jgi:hypothetical protein
MNLNSLLPHDAQSTQNKVAIALEKKWQRTGLLEGLDNEVERRGMAVLLENQAKQLVTEANATSTSANAEEWAGVALPLVRRIFAEIAAKDFVSVQPMNLPSGLVFFLDFKYGTAQQVKGSTAGGNDFLTGQGRKSQGDSVFGITDAGGLGTEAAGGTAPSEGLYGAGRFGYTINDVTSSTFTLANSVTSARTGSVAVGTGVFSNGGNLTGARFDYVTNYNSELSASVVSTGAGPFTILSIPTASLSNPDLNGLRAFNVQGTNLDAVYPEFTRLSKGKGHIEFLVEADSDLNAVTVIYQKQPGAASRGDFEDPTALTNNVKAAYLDIPEINLELRSEAIVAKTRKLKAIWSPEFAQDLNAYHSIDAEAELTSMLSEYISQEIDLEILDMLIQNAQTVDRWSAKIGFEWSAASNSFVQSNATAQAYNQGTWFQTLGTKIQKVSNRIHQLTVRGGANFLVCSPSVATILESIPGYAADTDGDKMQFAMGVQKVGAINNRFQVYKNPYMTENVILMGYRGSQFLETGAVYAPYVPLIMTPLVYDPNNFTPRKGVMTRYAKKMVRPEFYGKVYVSALDTI